VPVTSAPPILAVFPPANGAVNFARDDALVARARETGRVWMRVYTWDGPIVSFGRHERTRGRFSPEKIASASIGAARRQTGGRALLHHRELTYAIAGPVTDTESLRGSYTRIGNLLVTALQSFGIAVSIASRRAHARASDDAAACFASPAAGELIVHGRKLVASAQWRERDAYLQHGSMLIDNDQPLLETVLADGATLAPLEPPATLRELLARAPSASEFADALAAAITREWGIAPERVAPGDVVHDDALRPLVAHFGDPAWTWRR
jgi:lipoate-protein ligase A